MEPVGCGALKLHGPDPAEVKRMWVAPTVRGLGVGRRLLAELEDCARERAVTAPDATRAQPILIRRKVTRTPIARALGPGVGHSQRNNRVASPPATTAVATSTSRLVPVGTVPAQASPRASAAAPGGVQLLKVRSPSGMISSGR